MLKRLNQSEFAQRSQSTRVVDPFLAMDILAAATAREARGLPTYHLEVGQPGARLPEAVVDSASKSLKSDPLGYTASRGIRPLRERLSALYEERYGLDVDPSRFLITTGSSAAFSLAFLLLCDPGDRILLPRPGYPAYRNIARALGLVPVEVDLLSSNDWTITCAQINEAQREGPIRCMILASPDNPTGSVLSPQTMQQIVSCCEDAGIWFISDEIYHGLNFKGNDVCALTFDDDALIINSFSKYFCMTGWRIGWMVLPERLVDRADRFAQNLFICAPALSQKAALAALDEGPAFERVKAGYSTNRARLKSLVSSLGIDHGPSPDGAFYMYLPVEKFLRPGETSQELCGQLLGETGVAITPGRDFDPGRGDRWVRISYAGKKETIATAADLMTDWLQRRAV
ncbi:MAG: aminotransferase class I/II-fold pyridoxal phosphate-dependent enzyme [Pseudomonadota bacterium]